MEHGSRELTCEVDLAFGSVIESKPDPVVADVLGFDDVCQHWSHSKGSIRGSGISALAKSHADNSSDSCKRRHSCT